MMEEAFIVEDILLNETNNNHTFMYTTPVEKNAIEKQICSPKLGFSFTYFLYIINL